MPTVFLRVALFATLLGLLAVLGWFIGSRVSELHNFKQDSSPAELPPNVKFWFNFGDSYSETGFSINRTQPSVGNPLGNPPYPGRTSSSDGGANWVDALTTMYNKSLTLTYNFAWGGATINRTILPPGQDISLEDQVRNFTWWNTAKNPESGWTSENALFAVWMGVNDIKISYNWIDNFTQFSGELLDYEFGMVQTLYDSGGRNFLFNNVPPIDRMPESLSLPSATRDRQRAAVNTFNSLFTIKVNNFQKSHSQAQVWLFDAHALFTEALDDPSQFGFVDATSEGNNSQFWGNSIHPSSPAHDIIARRVADLLP